MKKQIKILTIAIMTVVILATLGNVVFGASSTLSALKNPGTVKGTSEVQKFGGQIVGILQIVGVIAAVVILLVIGIKYMMGSAEEKAEYKKVMVPYLIGALLLFAAVPIVGAIYNMFSNISM